MAEVIRVVLIVAETAKRLAFTGREAFTINALIEAGEKGVRPIDRPAPRWSHYVMMLRRAGLDIETIREPHGGPFPGSHGRYVLRTGVAVVARRGAKDNAPS